MSEREQLFWGDIATLEYGRALRGYQNGVGPVRVFGTNGPVGWTSEVQSDGPGVVIGRKGAYRGVHYSEGPFWVIDTAYFLKPKRKLDLRWAYYALRKEDINSMDSGSAIPSTSRADFYALRVSLPPLAEQKEIAGILGALDDKIAANKRTAITAMRLAHALFWQVQKGASLSCKIGVHINLVYGKALREPDRRLGPVPVFGCTGQVGWHDSALSVGPSAVVGRKGANAGYVSWSSAPCWVIDTAFYVQTKNSLLTNEFSYFLLKDADLSKLVGDSAIPGLNRSAVLDQVIRVPDESEIREFTAQVKPLLSIISLMAEQNQRLNAMRDALLPRLMSGEIRVRDAEKAVEDAT